MLSNVHVHFPCPVCILYRELTLSLSIYTAYAPLGPYGPYGRVRVRMLTSDTNHNPDLNPKS